MMKLTQDQLDHIERLCGAMLHWERDEESKSNLYALELADGQFLENPNREEVAAAVSSLTEQMQRALLYVYDERWQGFPPPESLIPGHDPACRCYECGQAWCEANYARE